MQLMGSLSAAKPMAGGWAEGCEGQKSPYIFRQFFGGVTSWVGLADFDGCCGWQSLPCICPGSAPHKLCGGGSCMPSMCVSL